MRIFSLSTRPCLTWASSDIMFTSALLQVVEREVEGVEIAPAAVRRKCRRSDDSRSAARAAPRRHRASAAERPDPDRSCRPTLDPSTVSRSATITRSPTRSGGSSNLAQASTRERTSSTPGSAAMRAGGVARCDRAADTPSQTIPAHRDARRTGSVIGRMTRATPAPYQSSSRSCRNTMLGRPKASVLAFMP